MQRRCSTWIVVLLVLAAGAHETFAAKVLHMNLEQLYRHSGTVVSGTVVAVVDGTVEAGGGVLPAVTYRILVEEHFRGAVESYNGVRFVEWTTLGAPKTLRVDGLRRAVHLPQAPRLEVGERYLLLLTERSSAGLSVPVGLEQGCFRLVGPPGNETATNGLHNVGLFRGDPLREAQQPGPIAFAALAQRLRAYERAR